ncbi:nucleotide exchange factor fes1 domain-containing protein [Hirsutella rhossiliensis]|uniref:Nucleotide exchange factor fes1 domain-containing protein n=1 Tax=Hirsutella rhossiliensis TaxID=111463 RepID=A0A9P8N343_9HYPO|nr:nucleotide exchange factor fes1 domain-containing protein [Hirsutella rhossiliensis]KAH0965096.1 nucleotide exchange factor fes1 domain-containing protein [Hirsutella rhossiliensis]
MENKGLNDLLRWGIENSADTPGGDSSAQQQQQPAHTTNLTPDVMAALMGGPSDADLMKASMEIITAPLSDQVSVQDKLIAFDNFEQLIEGLDNANNIANLGLWTPLLAQLDADESELRKMAAWCIGTAVQNNERTQERLLAVGGLPALVAMAVRGEEKEDVRRKAVYALSSACRNYQPAMDACTEELTSRGQPTAKIDAMDMEAVDHVMNALREQTRAA